MFKVTRKINPGDVIGIKQYYVDKLAKFNLTVEPRRFRGNMYYYYVLLYDGRIKWKITPVVTYNNKILKFRLLHYYTSKYHVQDTAWGTLRGFRELMLKIIQHEEYEISE